MRYVCGASYAVGNNDRKLLNGFTLNVKVVKADENFLLFLLSLTKLRTAKQLGKVSSTWMCINIPSIPHTHTSGRKWRVSANIIKWGKKELRDFYHVNMTESWAYKTFFLCWLFRDQKSRYQQRNLDVILRLKLSPAATQTFSSFLSVFMCDVEWDLRSASNAQMSTFCRGSERREKKATTNVPLTMNHLHILIIIIISI